MGLDGQDVTTNRSLAAVTRLMTATTVFAIVGPMSTPDPPYPDMPVAEGCKRVDTAQRTMFTELPGRGHSLTIDSGWAEVAQTALDFIRRFT
jgi:hypothetical protein